MKLRPIGAAAAVLVAATTITLALTSTAVAQGEVLVTDKDSKGWEFKSETAGSGNVEFAAGGLRLTTGDSGKAAGFVGVSGVTLKAVADAPNDPSLQFRKTEGTSYDPGFQIDMNSVQRGWVRIIKDPQGNTWSATSSCKGCANVTTLKPSTAFSGGFSGTLDDWAAGYTDATVNKIGFALGTASKLQGVLTNVRFMGTTYRFAAAEEPDTTNPEPPTAIDVCELASPAGPAFIAELEKRSVADAQAQVNRLGENGITLLDTDTKTPTVDIDDNMQGFIVNAVDRFVADRCGDQGNGNGGQGNDDNGTDNGGTDNSGSDDDGLNPGPIVPNDDDYSQVGGDELPVAINTGLA